MDPQVKGAILGGVGTAAVLSLGYIMKRSFSKNELPVETQLTTSQNVTTKTVVTETPYEEIKEAANQNDEFTALLGDVGGTNVRLILVTIHLNDRDKKVELKQKTYNSTVESSFEYCAADFLKVEKS